jgi:hypothetical protein
MPGSSPGPVATIHRGAPEEAQLPSSHDNIYTQEEFARIAGSFKIKPEPPYSLQEHLEKLAWIYKEGAAENDPLLKPYERLRHLKSHYNSVRKGREAWRAIIDNHYLERAVRAAATERLKEPNGKPSFEVFQARHIYLDQQFDGIEKVNDLKCELLGRAVADLKVEIKASGGKGGNRADVPLYEFVRGLWEMYVEVAAEPEDPNGWRASATERSGEFLDFLAACLSPLEKKRRRPSNLLQLYQRACT